MAEPTLYERLGGIFAIAAVVDNFSDRLLKNPTIVQANPELHQWHTVTYLGRLPGLKWLRTLWLASLAGGPFQYTGRELRDAHFDLKIPPEVFDEVAAELAYTLDDFNVPEREKGEVLAGFAGEKGEVTAGSQPGPSIGAAGAEPGAIPALNSNPGTAGHDAAEAVTRGGRCQTIKQRGQAGQSVTTGRLARATGQDDTLDPTRSRCSFPGPKPTPACWRHRACSARASTSGPAPRTTSACRACSAARPERGM